MRRESIWVLSNAVNHGNDEQICLLAENQVIDSMVRQLDTDDSKILVGAWECIKRILLNGVKYIKTMNENPFLNHFDALGVSKIEKLQEHKSEDVYKAAIGILETFYNIHNPI